MTNTAPAFAEGVAIPRDKTIEHPKERTEARDDSDDADYPGCWKEPSQCCHSIPADDDLAVESHDVQFSQTRIDIKILMKPEEILRIDRAANDTIPSIERF
jgi:hypothetical protein